MCATILLLQCVSGNKVFVVTFWQIILIKRSKLIVLDSVIKQRISLLLCFTTEEMVSFGLATHFYFSLLNHFRINRSRF